MTPSHSRKAGKLYRYYVATDAIRQGYSECAVRSVPAAEVEEAVVAQVRHLLRTPEIIAWTWAAARNEVVPEREVVKSVTSSVPRSCVGLSCRSCLSRLQFLDQRLESFGAQSHLHAIGREIDPFDQQTNDPRLLGRKQLVPQRREIRQGSFLPECHSRRAGFDADLDDVGRP